LLEQRHDALPYGSLARPGSDDRDTQPSAIGDTQRASLGDTQRAALGDSQRATHGDAGSHGDAYAGSIAIPLTGPHRDRDAGGRPAPVRLDGLAGRGLSARDERDFR
jgi:hypothetical protein